MTLPAPLLVPLLISIQLLTRIPVRLPGLPSDSDVGKSLLYYPLVGFLIACILLIPGLLFSHTAMMAAALVLSGWVLITGGLHLDGLADSADAWVGGFGDREKTLALMKDPTCGPVAVAVLILVMLIKFAGLVYIIEHGHLEMIVITLIASRSAVIVLYQTTPYAKSSGMGVVLSEYFPKQTSYWVLAVAACACLIVGGGVAIILLLTGLLTLWGLRRMMLSRIGGITGDTTGAVIELSEASMLAAAVFCL